MHVVSCGSALSCLRKFGHMHKFKSLHANIQTARSQAATPLSPHSSDRHFEIVHKHVHRSAANGAATEQVQPASVQHICTCHTLWPRGHVQCNTAAAPRPLHQDGHLSAAGEGQDAVLQKPVQEVLASAVLVRHTGQESYRCRRLSQNSSGTAGCTHGTMALPCCVQSVLVARDVRYVHT